MLRLRNSDEELTSLVMSNINYQSIDKDTAMMMREFANIKLPRSNKEGKYNVCKAIRDLERKSAERALAEAIKNLMKNGEKSFNESCILLGINATDMVRYRKMI